MPQHQEARVGKERCCDVRENRTGRVRHPLPLHGGAGGLHRDRLAGPLGGRGHLQRRQPRRRSGRPRGGQGEVLPAGHVPLPLRQGTARGPPAGLHRHRRRRPLHPDDRQERPVHDGLRRLRPARRAVRRHHRPAPAHLHRGQHRQHAPPAAPPGPVPRPAPLPGHDRRRLRALDPVDLPAGLQLLVRPRGPAPRRPRQGRGPAGVRAARQARLRPGPRPRRPRLGRPERRRAGRGHRLLPPGLRLQRPRQLVPRPGHGAGQRGGHLRGPLRAGQLPGLQAQPAPVDDAHHRLRRPPRRGPGHRGLAREGQAHAAQLDRTLRGRRGDLRRARGRSGRPAGRVAERLHHPPRHPLRRHLHGGGPRAPHAGWPAGLRLGALRGPTTPRP